MPVGDFSAFEAAPHTKGREEVREAGQGGLEQFCADILASEACAESEVAEAITNVKFPFPASDLWSCEDVKTAYDLVSRTNTAVRAIGLALRNAGAQPVPRVVKIGGRPMRLFSIRNHDKWAAEATIEGENRQNIAKEYARTLSGSTQVLELRGRGETHSTNKVTITRLSENSDGSVTIETEAKKAKFEG